MSDIKHVNKRRFGEQLIKLLNSGHYVTESSLTLPQAMLFVAQARDKLARDSMLSRRGDYESFDIYAQFLTTYTEKTRPMPNGRKGVYLPLKYRPLNILNNEGIFEVFFTADETDNHNQLLPLPAGFNSMFRGSSDLEGMAGYIPEKDKLIIVGYDTPDAEITVKLIASSVDMDEYDMFPISGDMEYDVLRMALELAGVSKQMAKDIINDNVNQ
mgnify:CR=1 FL=1